MVSAAYDISEAFGLYVQTHAETGSRSSQIARCLVGDLHNNKLIMPASRKGHNGGRGGHVGVPLTPNLAEQLRKAAASRGPREPLLRRADGEPWRCSVDHSHPFEQAARKAGLPAGTTIYSLRHSSIARALLRNMPIKVVADWHDTSTAMIDRHYGRFISRHSDDLIRAVLLGTSPTKAPANVVPLRS